MLRQLDGLYGYFTLDARVPRDLNRAEPARSGSADRLVAVEYKGSPCHNAFRTAIDRGLRKRFSVSHIIHDK